MAIRNLLIANRGEIAVRIVRAARELSIRTIQVHSTADAESLAVKLADEAIAIGPPQAAKSYLNIPAIIDAAKKTGADAVHPGYGFLAENAGFAEAVVGAGLIFVGPSAAAIRTMGDKVAARQAAAKAGVPTVPGSDGRVDDLDAAHAVIAKTGFPIMIKGPPVVAGAASASQPTRTSSTASSRRRRRRPWRLSAMAGSTWRR